VRISLQIYFRGFIAAASLKLREPDHRRGQLSRHFRGFIAAASLKLRS